MRCEEITQIFPLFDNVKTYTPNRLGTECTLFDCSKGTECALCAQSVRV